MTTFTEYQDATDEVAVYPEAGEGTIDALTYAVFGLVGEAGEIANKFKKVIRDHDGNITPAVREAILEEVGDTLWYAARLCTELDADFSDVAEDNVGKLLDRQKRGVLKGSGDDR